MQPISSAQFRDNLRRISDRINDALLRAGRKEGETLVMAVTKTLPREAAELAVREGLGLLGENRVQEAEAKYGDGAPAELHLIGHLQRNKAKKAAALFSCVQSVDKLETARELDRCAQGLGKRLSVLLQLNTSGEESKSGYRDPEVLLEELEEIRSLSALTVNGLMTIGPLAGDEKAVRNSFTVLKSLFDRIRAQSGVQDFTVLSMGMSQDFETAVEEGSTLVRIGTALFGERGMQ
jgi:pyridoxal phosphate enzyme (YggS family)